MRLTQVICSFAKSKNNSKYLHLFCQIRHHAFVNFITCKKPESSSSLTNFRINKKFINTITEVSDEEPLEDVEELEDNSSKELHYARYLLFKNSTDPVLSDLTKCASVEEVFEFFNKHSTIYNTDYLTQTILVLHDLQKMCYLIHGANKSREFFEQLCENSDFNVLLSQIQNKIEDFTNENLCYVFYHLNRLGVSVEDPLLQSIALRVEDGLNQKLCLESCAMFLKVIFKERNYRPYFLAQNLVPKIYNQLDLCESLEDFIHLTTCLSRLEQMVTGDKMEKYREKVKYFLDSNLLAEHPSAILEIITFLNNSNWRTKNHTLIIQCILLLKNRVNELNARELSVLYKVFFSNQEPGQMLNEIQRSSSKFLQSDDPVAITKDIRLALFSSLIYFSSPTHRIQFRTLAQTYLDDCETHANLNTLRKIFSYVKISDRNLCEKYWEQIMQFIKEETDISNILRVSENYLYFNTDLDNYRHKKFESFVLSKLEDLDNNNIALFPSQVAQALSFALEYSTNSDFIRVLIQELADNYKQLTPLDCYKLARSLQQHLKQNGLEENTSKLQGIIDKAVAFQIPKDNFQQTVQLLKANIVRGIVQGEETNALLMQFKDITDISSKVLENICFCFVSTNCLIPEVINKLTEYVIVNKNNLLGFNVEKLLFLCYYLAYYPYNADKFFESVSDIILRDQERLSGLAFVHSALSLCYFNKLPNSFIKLIFNVQFLEKLDVELANCYAKEIYPHRVRNGLMQLNRAVCLEYPENNIPWFHQKYVDERKKARKSEIRPYAFANIRESLKFFIHNHACIWENVITPYGYQIDFVINLNDRNEATDNMNQVKTKLAILLVPQEAFTRLYIQLKGKYQLKKRHLEMLGYKVLTINFDDWTNLLYTQEKLDFLSDLIWNVR